ncbi:hypothetical_protein [Leishmania major strain Friedlin]|nr:hypothetical_protein [Leishmania major strain Friedlin]
MSARCLTSGATDPTAKCYLTLQHRRHGHRVGCLSRARGDSTHYRLLGLVSRVGRSGFCHGRRAFFPPNDVPTVVHYIETERALVSVVANVLQESLTPPEHAVVEICSEIPLLTLLDATRLHPKSSLTFAPDGDAQMNALGQFVRAF